MKLIEQTVHDGAASAVLRLRPDERYRPRCHVCGAPAATVHSRGHRRLIRDLNVASSQIWLHVDYRKVWCENCAGARVEQLSFCHAGKRVTQRLARYVHELCKLLPVKHVAEHFDLDPKTVKDIDKSFLEQEFGGTDLEGLRVLALDEIALKKGHKYMTVVLDWFSGRVVWMGENRDKATLDAFFSLMTPAQKNRIEAVAMDMWDPFINRVKHHCPDAKIVFDFFHIVAAFGKVIDKIRREQYLKANAKEKAVLKGSRYLLLKNQENLTEEQRPRLARVLEINQTLNAIYILKDQLKLLYFHSDREKAQETLDHWCALAEELDEPSLRPFINRLRRHAYGILNHAEYPIDTSRLEGVNNKIKVIKRRSYGYHDTKYFALKVKQAFPGQDYESTNFFG
jgi:transposase